MTTDIQDLRLELAMQAHAMGMRVVALQPDHTPRDDDELAIDVEPTKCASGHGVVVGANGVRAFRLELGDLDRMKATADESMSLLIDRLIAGPAFKDGKGRLILYRTGGDEDGRRSLLALTTLISGSMRGCAELTEAEVERLEALRSGTPPAPGLPRASAAEADVGVARFGDVAIEYRKRDWPVVPIPAGAKLPPEPGRTGRSGVDADLAQVEQWVSERAEWNIALRMPAGVVGIDVDQYDAKRGADNLHAFQAEHGLPDLPPTVWLTSRGQPSGIRLFQVPLGIELENSIGDVDIVQRHHRYAMAPPSVHPSGAEYRAIDEDSGEILETLPYPDELPDLPHEWLRALASNSTGHRVREEPMVWHNEKSHAPDWHPKVLDTFEGWQARKASRHDSMIATQNALVRLDSFELAGAGAALDRLRSEFVDAVTADGSRQIEEADAEFERGLSGARRLVAATEATSEPTARSARVGGIPNLPDEFWDALEPLRHIRQAARSRMIGPDALLGCVLTRVSFLTHHALLLPAIIGGPGSLDVIHAIVGQSGVGKSQAMSEARRLLPLPVEPKLPGKPQSDLALRDGKPIGSGEGLIEAYYTTRPADDGTKKQERAIAQPPAVLFSVDEGQALVEIGTRANSSLLPNLRSMWSGSVVGQTNATTERQRHLPAHGYRMAMELGIQPEKAAAILSDKAGGTPQRFCWFSALDRGMLNPVENDLPPWPGTLPWHPPTRDTKSWGSWEVGYVDSIKAQIRMAHYQAHVGEGPATSELDSHSMLVQLKVAALLVILDGRLEVTEDDWALATIVMTTSKALRSWIEDRVRAEQASIEESSTERAARRASRSAEAVHEAEVSKATLRAARSISGAIHRHGPMTRGAAWTRPASRDRDVTSQDEAFDFAIDQGWIVALDDGKLGPGPSRPT